MRESMESVLAGLISVAGQALVALLVAKLSGLMDWLFAKAKGHNFALSSAKEDAAKTAVVEIVAGAVREVYQEFVEALKKQGPLTKADAKQALEMARVKVVSRIPRILQDTLKEMAGTEALDTAAEHVVNRVVNELDLRPVATLNP